MSGPTLYRETQQMRQAWLWTGLGVTGALLIATGSVGGVVILVPVAVLLFTIRLTTEVREDGVYVRFAPIHRTFRRIPFDQIQRVDVTEFGLLTYGGVGLRWTPNAIAYTTRRGDGIEIERRSAKTVVIGSQDAETLAETIGDRL